MGISIAVATAVLVSAGLWPQFITVQGEQPEQFVAGDSGRTLYVYDGDLGNMGGDDRVDTCLDVWPPLAAAADDVAVGDWKPVLRRDLRWQWSYKGRPVYHFTGDSSPGVANGGGSGGVWHALVYEGIAPKLTAPPAVAVKRRSVGFVLTDYRGQTLYTFAEDGEMPACNAECLEVWPPVRAAALATKLGDWTPVDRPDGIRQWAYSGRLVYTYSGDTGAQDMRGANAGGVWQIVRVESSPAAAIGSLTVGNSGASKVIEQ